MRGRHGKPAVVGDAHLDLGAAVVADEARARRSVRPGQDFDPAAGKADPRAVEALDHRFFGRPAAGQPFVVAGAVGELGGCVDLVKEAATGAPYRERDPINRDGVYPDPLHPPIIRRSPTWRGFAVGRRPGRARPGSPARGPRT